MITETNYSRNELKKGKCRSCSERSNEILITDGRCIDCIEAEKFIEQTMGEDVFIQANHKNPFDF